MLYNVEEIKKVRHIIGGLRAVPDWDFRKRFGKNSLERRGKYDL